MRPASPDGADALDERFRVFRRRSEIDSEPGDELGGERRSVWA